MNEQNLYNYENILFKNMITTENSWNTMPPSEFDLLVLPEKEEEDERDRKNNKQQDMNNLVAPKEYLMELEKRNKYYSSFKSKVSKGGLSG